MFLLQIDSPLIGSFIRLRGCTIHPAESERVLSKYGRYMELVELYNVMGQHEKGVYVYICVLCMCVLYVHNYYTVLSQIMAGVV